MMSSEPESMIPLSFILICFAVIFKASAKKRNGEKNWEMKKKTRIIGKVSEILDAISLLSMGLVQDNAQKGTALHHDSLINKKQSQTYSTNSDNHSLFSNLFFSFNLGKELQKSNHFVQKSENKMKSGIV